MNETCEVAGTRNISMPVLQASEAAAMAIQALFEALLQDERDEMGGFPEATGHEREKMARSRASRALDRGLALFARRAKGEL